MEDGFTSGYALGNSGKSSNMWDNGMGIFGIIALLAFAGGGFGNWGNNNRGYEGSLVANDALISNALQTSQLEATANQRQTCMDFANTNSNIVNGNYQTQSIAQTGFANITRDLGTAATGIVQGIQNTREILTDRLASVGSSLASCCCETQRAIDGVNYNGAINTAAINANTTAMGQKILDALAQNKIETLQSQVSALQLQSALNGVVRYPQATTYCSGANPFGCGCGCNA